MEKRTTLPNIEKYEKMPYARSWTWDEIKIMVRDASIKYLEILITEKKRAK